MGCSTLCHLFFIHSEKTSNFLSQLDYGGISILIMGSSYPPLFYCFSCKEVFWIRDLFLGVITTLSIACFIAVFHPIMNTSKYRGFRAAIFVTTACIVAIPFTILDNAPKSMAPYINHEFTLYPWVLGGVSYIGGAIIYAMRIPEKYYPKTFDYCGHSHNIFHVAVIIGCAIHFNAGWKLFLSS